MLALNWDTRLTESFSCTCSNWQLGVQLWLKKQVISSECCIYQKKVLQTLDTSYNWMLQQSFSNYFLISSLFHVLKPYLTCHTSYNWNGAINNQISLWFPLVLCERTMMKCLCLQMFWIVKWFSYLHLWRWTVLFNGKKDSTRNETQWCSIQCWKM
jgi:hypothetical protein